MERARRHPDDAYAWIMAHRQIRGRPPIHMPALVDIARDRHPRIVIQKSAQVGLTELAVNRALHAADTGYADRGHVLYLMPTRDQVDDFVASRFDVAIQDSAYLRSRLQPEPPRRKGADSVRQKQLGLGRIYTRGAEGSRQVASLDCDFVILDEFDQMREGTLERAEKRLASSRKPCLFVLSTPRLPESGINSLYLASDQRRYFIPCQACGEEQSLEWESNVDFSRAEVVCRKCRKPINVLAKGRWVAAPPESSAVHGYHLSRLYSPWANIPAMIEASQATTPLALQEFYNSDLGEPYVAPGGGLNVNELDACRGEYDVSEYAEQPCVMGIDVGLKLHVVIRETEEPKRHGPWSRAAPAPFVARLWFAGEVSFADIERLIEQFNVTCCAIDVQPERTKVAELISGSRHGIWPVDYNRHEPGYVVVDGPPKTIRAHRVDFMDQVAQRFRSGQLSLPKDARQLGGRYRKGLGEYYREIMAPQREAVRDGRGNLDYKWDERGKDDHYFHAELYTIIAERMKGYYRISA